MRHQNIVKFSEELKGIDWENVVNKQNAQEAFSIFHKIKTEKYNLCFPIKKGKKRYYNKKPWLTSVLKQSIKVKNKLYVSRNKGNDIEQKVAFYKTYRNRLNHILRSAERKYYQDLLIWHKSNMKKSWNVIKMVINKRKYRQCCTKFVSNGKTVVDGKLIANRFKDFFVNVGSSLAKTIPLSPKDPTDYMTQNINVIFNINPVTGDEITKIMGQFKDGAAGWDTLKPSVMKNIKEYVKYLLAHICNLSFFTGVFPKELKLANVAPVFKANDEMIFTNYKPVSALPVFSKLIERLMYNRLVSYINENHLLCKYQFGFQAGKATYMALIVLIEKITEALDKGESVIGIFLDFSKAFDTVDHGVLLVKLHRYGVQDTAHSWFQDYLTNRMQYVTHNSIKSEPKMIDCGVPQGSILGPLLFLLYINDLSTVSVSCFTILFADDTNMFITGKDIQDMCHRLNEDLVKIQEWLCCNKLSLNVSKTHYMVFTPRNKIVNDVNDINIMIHSEKIERVYTTKFLGVQIDAQLNWKGHIEYTCKKLSKCIGILAKARKVLYKSCLINLYYTFAYPYFIYCNQVWGNAYQTNLEKNCTCAKKTNKTNHRISLSRPHRTTVCSKQNIDI